MVGCPEDAVVRGPAEKEGDWQEESKFGIHNRPSSLGRRKHDFLEMAPLTLLGLAVVMMARLEDAVVAGFEDGEDPTWNI